MVFSGRNSIYTWVIANFMWTVACTHSTKQVSPDNIGIPVTDTLRISSDKGSFPQMDGSASITDFVILQEDDRTMFADINQVIVNR